MVRKLALKKEHLAELSSDDLKDVVGGASGLPCASEKLAACQISREIISACGCLTNYCSIDVC